METGYIIIFFGVLIFLLIGLFITTIIVQSYP